MRARPRGPPARAPRTRRARPRPALRSRARHPPGLERRGMAAPDAPAVRPAAPEVADDERAAAILAEHRGALEGALEDRRGVPRDVDVALLHAVLVDVLVGEHLEPPRSRHHRRLWVHEHERVVLVEHRLGGLRVALLDAALE